MVGDDVSPWAMKALAPSPVRPTSVRYRVRPPSPGKMLCVVTTFVARLMDLVHSQPELPSR